METIKITYQVVDNSIIPRGQFNVNTPINDIITVLDSMKEVLSNHAAQFIAENSGLTEVERMELAKTLTIKQISDG
ncbi:hypothetical protein [Soonwooa sp.]|uniref:hypothetical protein n=1 Tax=Soonwooa sp. TaxID=1938592 RepID=UPI0028A646E9|nr:hypothetical protein [Soonwooa sp.]